MRWMNFRRVQGFLVRGLRQYVVGLEGWEAQRPKEYVELVVDGVPICVERAH